VFRVGGLRRRWLARGVLPALLAVALVAVAVTILLRGGSGAHATSPSESAGHGAIVPPAPVTHVVGGSLPVRIARVGGAPASLAWAAGAVWVADGRRVLQVDPSTLTIASRLPQRGRCEDSQVAAGFGSVWLTSGLCRKPGLLTKIDPASGRSLWHVRIPAIARGVTAWVRARRMVVTTQEGGARWALAEVNPANRHVVGLSGTLHGAIDTNPDASGLTALVATPAGFWAEPSGYGGAARIVPHGTHVTGNVFYANQAKAGLAYGDGILFAGLGEDVLQLDPTTGDEVARPLQPPGVIITVAYGANNVWIATSDGRIYRYPPGDHTLALAARLPWEATTLTTGGGFLWAASYTTGSIARIGPAPTS
jgi:hypothetical protein